MVVTRAGINKMLSEQQTGKTLKQSDLGLGCLSTSFCKVTCVRNFRTLTVDIILSPVSISGF